MGASNIDVSGRLKMYVLPVKKEPLESKDSKLEGDSNRSRRAQTE